MSTTTDFNFNTAGKQRAFDVIPNNTLVELQLTIRPGGAGDGGYLTRSKNGESEGLDCECVVVDDNEYKKRKIFEWLLVSGTTPGQVEMAESRRNMIRAIIESARGIRPDDASEAATAARRISSWEDLQNIRFLARVGVKPPADGYDAKNFIKEVVTPERQNWRKVEQIVSAEINETATPAPNAKPANAIARPQWADDNG
jgi:hypothetical protein